MKRFFCISALFLCAACANDLGNYDYRDLTEPDITGIEANISVLTHARLQLTPDLGGNDFPDDRYSFEWRTLARSADETVTVIGTSRNLDYDVALPAGAYTLFFKVTEDASGVYWQTSSELQVSEATSEGWMVLCADGDDDRARLDMVSAVTGETYTDLLKDNGMPEMKGPRRIQWSRFADADSPYYLLTDDGATRLGRNGFEWKEEYRLIYEMGNSDDPRPWVINDASGSKMMVSDSKTYYAECLVSVGLFGPIGDTPLNAAPVIGSNIVTQNIVVPVVMMYDLDAKRFVGYAPNLRSPDVGGYAPLQEMNDLVKLLGEMDNGGRVTGDAFAEFPQGLDFVWMENTKYDPNSTNMGVVYTVLKDGDRYCLYGTQLGELWSVVTVGDCTQALSRAYYGDLSGCTNIARAEHFAFSSLKNYMYYAVGGTVYRVDLSEKPLTATTQFTLVGETVTCLKFNIYRQSANLTRTYDLVVGSVKDDTGTLRIYEGFNSDGNFRGVAPEVHTGLGRIVDVAYREMLK